MTDGSQGPSRERVLFLGDSNLFLARGRVLDRASEAGFVAFAAAKIGMGVRVGDYWAERLAEARAHFPDPEVYVLNLGVNDATKPHAKGHGYGAYPAKIDWLLGLLGGRPVYWTNVPCAIEPPQWWTGCAIVNQALDDAQDRWPNLTVLDWAGAANSHPEYVGPADVHYTEAGLAAWTAFVVDAITVARP